MAEPSSTMTELGDLIDMFGVPGPINAVRSSERTSTSKSDNSQQSAITQTTMPSQTSLRLLSQTSIPECHMSDLNEQYRSATKTMSSLASSAGNHSDEEDTEFVMNPQQEAAEVINPEARACNDDPEVSRNAVPAHPDPEWSEGLTTVLVRNIALRLTKEAVIAEFDNLGLSGLYEDITVPIRKVSHRCALNPGYFFVNFRNPRAALLCRELCHKRPFGNTGSRKLCEVVPARRQADGASHSSGMWTRPSHAPAWRPEVATQVDTSQHNGAPGHGWSHPLLHPPMGAGFPPTFPTSGSAGNDIRTRLAYLSSLPSRSLEERVRGGPCAGQAPSPGAYGPASGAPAPFRGPAPSITLRF